MYTHPHIYTLECTVFGYLCELRKKKRTFIIIYRKSNHAHVFGNYIKYVCHFFREPSASHFEMHRSLYAVRYNIRLIIIIVQIMINRVQ